jgi:hypothetical protein
MVREQDESSTILNEMQSILDGKVPITPKRQRKKKAYQYPGLSLVNLLRSNIRDLGDLGPIPEEKKHEEVEAKKKKRRKPKKKTVPVVEQIPEIEVKDEKAGIVEEKPTEPEQLQPKIDIIDPETEPLMEIIEEPAPEPNMEKPEPEPLEFKEMEPEKIQKPIPDPVEGKPEAAPTPKTSKKPKKRKVEKKKKPAKKKKVSGKEKLAMLLMKAKKK